MLYGIGTDIIEIERIASIVTKYGKRFLDRIFSEEEQLYCLRHTDAARHFAGRFAGKEAVVKALGTGIRKGVGWLDIIISNDSYGKPQVMLSAELQALFPKMTFLLSISHCRAYASAFAVCQKQE